MKILVIEDEKDVRVMLVCALKTMGGHNVIEADDGGAGIGVLRENPDIELAICDIDMPVATGFEVLKYMVDSGHQARKIMMSARMTTDVAEDVVAKGAECGIYKPNIINILFDKGLLRK